MIDRSAVLRRNPRVEFRTLAEEGGVLLHLDTASYHGVNDIGAYVWEVLDGLTLDDVLRRVRGEVDHVPDTFEGEIEEFVGELVARDLVRFDPPPAG
jgi:hypothetical protein